MTADLPSPLNEGKQRVTNWPLPITSPCSIKKKAEGMRQLFPFFPHTRVGEALNGG